MCCVHVCAASPAVLQVWLDQADGQVLTEGEEVTLMDWGNAFIRVSTRGGGELGGGPKRMVFWQCHVLAGAASAGNRSSAEKAVEAAQKGEQWTDIKLRPLHSFDMPNQVFPSCTLNSLPSEACSASVQPHLVLLQLAGTSACTACHAGPAHCTAAGTWPG